jgi:arylsulfatase
MLAFLFVGCAQPVQPPNVVIIFADDLGYADVGPFGNPPYPTPNLDQMAEDGVRLTNFYVSQPVCSASRASLLTGAYSNRLGIHGALGPGARHGLHDEETTLAEVFKSQGYATAIFGKWHLGHLPEFLPTRHGFDEFAGIPYSNDMWPFHPESPDAWVDLPTFDQEEIVGYNTDQTRFTTDFTARGVEFIQRNAAAGQPFFLYLPHPMPHVPLFVSEERAGASGAGLFGDVIHEIDWSLGQIIQALDQNGLSENTLVIFTSDNGPWLSYGDHAGSALPLREGKGTAWDGGVRVPFLARWPGVLEAGRTVDAPAMTIDVLPALADLIGAERPQRTIDGESMWPLLSGRTETSPQESYYFWYRTNELHAMRSGRWKLQFPHTYRTMNGRELGSGGIPGKYDYSAAVGLELFDLESDLGEQIDVSASHPEVVAHLSALADSMRLELGDSLTDVPGRSNRDPGRVPPE